MVLALYYNQVANWHLHLLNNGFVVEHAHPYRQDKVPDTPYQQHQHTGFEYQILAQVSFLPSLLMVAAGFIALAPARTLSLTILPSPVYIEQYRNAGSQFRAPPF